MRDHPILTNRRVAGLAVLAAVLALIVLFVADNFALTEIQLLTLSLRVRLAWALLVAFGVGALVGLLAARLWRR